MGELRSGGFTLLELLLVLSILGVVAVVAIPSFHSAERQHLDLAAEEFSQAIRYARSEAMRVGEPRGFRQESSAKRIRLFRPDTSTSPWTPIYDIYHPVSRQLVDIELDKHPFAAADTLSLNATYQGTCSTAGEIYFDARGTPWCTDPETVLLDQFDLTFTLGSYARVVTVHGLSGRVTVQ
jgi:type II secretion system protein H